MKANKCLHVLRTLRKEQYSQAEIGLSFTSLFLPNFIYVIPVEKKGNKSTSRLAEHTVAVRSDTSWICCRGADN